MAYTALELIKDWSKERMSGTTVKNLHTYKEVWTLKN